MSVYFLVLLQNLRVPVKCRVNIGINEKQKRNILKLDVQDLHIPRNLIKWGNTIALYFYAKGTPSSATSKSFCSVGAGSLGKF